ncbi:MAG TPA: Cytochrome b/c1 [Hyphomicrobiaceae bacterium MAG_BT-2024]
MIKISSLVAVTAYTLILTTGAFAAGSHIEIPRNEWSFSGISGQYDKAQLQRGFQIYREACSSCHSLNRIAFRNLAQKGGPEFPEEELKVLASEYEVDALPNEDGEVKKRSAVLSDRFPPLYANEKEARSIHNGALPPDLSVIAKARGTAYVGPWYWHPFAMFADIFNGYQEGGSDYIAALLTGYDEPPETMEISEGMNYNKYYPGHQIAMANPFAGGNNQVEYQSAMIPSTVKQYAKDVAAFLSWASDPTLNQRKQTGWQVLVYLLITGVLLYIAKRRIWASVKH